jgi:hypothetical protein
VSRALARKSEKVRIRTARRAAVVRDVDELGLSRTGGSAGEGSQKSRCCIVVSRRRSRLVAEDRRLVDDVVDDARGGMFVSTTTSTNVGGPRTGSPLRKARTYAGISASGGRSARISLRWSERCSGSSGGNADLELARVLEQDHGGARRPPVSTLSIVECIRSVSWTRTFRSGRRLDHVRGRGRDAERDTRAFTTPSRVPLPSSDVKRRTSPFWLSDDEGAETAVLGPTASVELAGPESRGEVDESRAVREARPVRPVDEDRAVAGGHEQVPLRA